MRQVTEQVAVSFFNHESRTVSNSSTDGDSFWLHGNLIARRGPGDSLIFTLAGWPTPTTRERLNGILQVFGIRRRVYQHDWGQFLSEPGDGDDIPLDPDTAYQIRRVNYYDDAGYVGSGWEVSEYAYHI